jgi:tetratricopeptide (TPR) repeat protein
LGKATKLGKQYRSCLQEAETWRHTNISSLAPIQALRLEAYRTAGKALMDLGQFSFALEQIEMALSIDLTDLISDQYKGILLGRLKKYH